MKMERFSYIGKRVPNVDGMGLAMGSVKFVADVALPGMLYGEILRSPFPHAWIHRIDTTKAERLAGVRAVITGADFSKEKYGYVLGLKALVRDEMPLAWGKFRFVGHAVREYFFPEYQGKFLALVAMT